MEYRLLEAAHDAIYKAQIAAKAHEKALADAANAVAALPVEGAKELAASLWEDEARVPWVSLAEGQPAAVVMERAEKAQDVYQTALEAEQEAFRLACERRIA